jgi:hypothetical protein
MTGQKVLLFGLASTCAVAALTTIVSNRHPGANQGRLPIPIATEPCDGTQTTLEDAEAAMTFPIELPDDTLANDSNLAETLRCSETQVAFRYESGVIVYLSDNTLQDPPDVWQTMASEYPEFSMGIVRGVPASLADPTKGIDTIGGVDLVEDGVRLTVSGNGKIPLDDLIRVTESLVPVR